MSFDMVIPCHLTWWFHVIWHGDSMSFDRDSMSFDMVVPCHLTWWFHVIWHGDSMSFDMVIPCHLTWRFHVIWHGGFMSFDMEIPCHLTWWFYDMQFLCFCDFLQLYAWWVQQCASGCCGEELHRCTDPWWSWGYSSADRTAFPRSSEVPWWHVGLGASGHCIWRGTRSSTPEKMHQNP